MKIGIAKAGAPGAWRARPRIAASMGAWIVATLALTTGVAEAARVVEVRVGRHAEFTRVVFELDAPAGYRIARGDAAPGKSELVVSLEADAAPRNIEPRGGLISRLTVAPTGSGRSVARIQLDRSNARLKEMILAAPPRIVLDVMTDGTASAARPAARSAPGPAPEPVAEPEPAPQRAPVSRPPQGTLPAAEKPAESASETETSPAESAAETESEPEAPLAEPDAPTDGEPGSERGAEPPVVANRMPAPQAPPPSRRPPATTPRAAPGGDAGSALDLTWWLAGAAAVALLLFVIIRRRRSTAPAEELEAGFDNPFDELTGEPEDAEAMRSAAAPASTEEPAESESEPSLFDAPTALGAQEPVQEPAMQTSTESFEAHTSVASAPGDDVMRIVRELERRVASLENRLEEAKEARERLERQVTAQTEELRVQRAAIARTQRAVRSLSRTDDDAATEPAPRE